MKLIKTIKLYRTKNGHLIKIIAKDEEDTSICGVDESVCGDDEYDCAVSLLTAIKNEIGPSDGKYSPKRIRITYEPGQGADAFSEDEDMMLQRVLDYRREHPEQSWEEFGKAIYEKTLDEFQYSVQFKLKNDYKDLWYAKSYTQDSKLESEREAL